MKFLSVIFLLVCSNILFAQSTFKKSISISGAYRSFSRDITEINSNHYVLFGNSGDSINGRLVNRLTLLHTDSAGNVFFKKAYGTSSNYYVPTVTSAHSYRKIGQNFYVPLVGLDTLGRVYGALFKFDLNGDTIWQRNKFLSDSSEIVYLDLCQTKDGGLLVLGGVTTFTPNYNGNPTQQIYLSKLNTNGALLWEKKLNPVSPDKQEYGNSIIEDTVTKNIIVCGQYSTPANATGGIFIFDSIGNKISGFAVNYGHGTQLLDLIRIRDGNFVAVGNKLTGQKINDIPTTWSFLIKFAPNGSFIKTNLLDLQSINSSLTRILELPSGKLLTLGYQDWGNPSFNEINSVSRLTLLDQNCDFLWSKYYDNFTDDYNIDLPWGMAYTSDKRIIFTSTLYDPGYLVSTFMLYRTDTLACDQLVDSCSSITGLWELSKNESLLKIYPNPVLNNCFVEINTRQSESRYSIEITNVVGERLGFYEMSWDKIQLDFTAYRPGVFYCNLFADGKLITTKKIVK